MHLTIIYCLALTLRANNLLFYGGEISFQGNKKQNERKTKATNFLFGTIRSLSFEVEIQDAEELSMRVINSYQYS